MISINTTATIINEIAEKPSRTYGLDLDKGRIIGRIDNAEAINLYIRKAIITPRFGCLIYSSDYGSEIEAVLTSNGWNREVAKKLLPKLIKDALCDKRIINVYDFTFEDGNKSEDCLNVSFKADTIFGTTEIKEAIRLV